jgi:hypothetical protein
MLGNGHARARRGAEVIQAAVEARPQLRLLVIRLAVLGLGFMAGHSAFAGYRSVRQAEAAGESPKVPAAGEQVRVESEAAAQPQHVSPLRSGKSRRSVSRCAPWDDPNDDETSRDPDVDDETSQDLSRNDRADAPITWLWVTASHLTVPDDESALAGTEAPSSLFITLQRLRC